MFAPGFESPVMLCGSGHDALEKGSGLVGFKVRSYTARGDAMEREMQGRSAKAETLNLENVDMMIEDGLWKLIN